MLQSCYLEQRAALWREPRRRSTSGRRSPHWWTLRVGNDTAWKGAWFRRGLGNWCWSWKRLKIRYIPANWVNLRVPSVSAGGALHPIKVSFECIPIIDEKHDEDGRYSEDDDYEEIAQFSRFFPADHLPATLGGISTAAGTAAAKSFTTHIIIKQF